MCFTLQKIKPVCFDFENDLYSKESALMRKNIKKIMKKIDKSKAILK